MFIKYCVFFRFLKNILDSVFPRCQCVYTRQEGRKPALQQNWQSSEISQNFKEKTQYLMNTLYIKCNLYRGCHRSCVYLCVQKLPFSTYDVATITTYLAKIIGHHTFVICNAFQISTYFIVYLCIV